MSISPNVTVDVRIPPASMLVWQQQLLTRVGNQISNGARVRANVDTGLMRSAISFRLDFSATPARGDVVAATRYAYWVHNGNGRYQGNPFLTDAARAVLGG